MPAERGTTSGLKYLPAYFDRPAQEALVATLRDVLAKAPFYTPVMPKSGRPLTVHMSNLGPLGWVTDRTGYRYDAVDPETGHPWPRMPELFQRLAEDAAARGGFGGFAPDACLVNRYQPGARSFGGSGTRVRVCRAMGSETAVAISRSPPVASPSLCHALICHARKPLD